MKTTNNEIPKKRAITRTTRYFKGGKECLPEEADEVIVNEFDENDQMIDETIYHLSPKQPKPAGEAKQERKL